MMGKYVDIWAEQGLTFRLLVGYRWIGLLPPLVWLTFSGRRAVDPEDWWALGLAAGLALLLTLRAAPINRGLLKHPWLLVFDLLFSASLVWYSGAERSPYYLYSLAPILAAAFFFRIRGGLLAAAVYTAVYLPLVFFARRLSEPSINLPNAVGQLISFFLIGASFGYLSQLLQRLRNTHDDLADKNVELSRRNRDLDLLQKLTLIMQSSVDPAELQESILQGLVQEMNYRRAVIGLYDPGRNALTGWLSLEEGPGSDGLPTIAHTDILPLDKDDGPLARALDTGHAVEVLDGEPPTNSRELNTRLIAGDHYIVMPLNLREHPLGVMLIDRLPSRQPLSQIDRISVDRLSAHAGVTLGSVRMCIDRAQREAVTVERNRIAADLHDSISQILYGLAYGLEACLQLLPDEPENVQAALSKLYPMVLDAQAKMRSAIFGLWSDDITSDAFVAGLHRHLRAVCPARKVGLQIELPADFDLWEATARIHLYRIAQEALANAAKHAEAHQVIVALVQEQDHIELRVQDDGCGFNQEKVDNSRNLGLQIISERVQWLGGNFGIDGRPGKGTAITVTIPRASAECAPESRLRPLPAEARQGN